MLAELIFKRNPDSIEPSPREKIYEILRSSYDYQADHIFYDAYVQLHTEYHKIIFYLDECDQPARTRETLCKLQDLIEDYL